MNVIGQENLWAERPAVFIFNHQSQLDVLILGSLIRQDFTGVAQDSGVPNPGCSHPSAISRDVAYIDRGKPTGKDALAPVVEASGGRSIAISPGDAPHTDRVLPFKKGAFHIAMQAEVPLVPIVIRNAGELMRPDAPFMAPGRLDVRSAAAHLHRRLAGVRAHRAGRRGSAVVHRCDGGVALIRGARRGLTLDLHPLTVETIPAAAEVARRIWPRSYAEVLSPEQIDYQLSQRTSEAFFRSLPGRSGSGTTSLSGDRVIGYCSYHLASVDELRLDQIYVDPDLYGQGFGQQLLTMFVGSQLDVRCSGSR